MHRPRHTLPFHWYTVHVCTTESYTTEDFCSKVIVLGFLWYGWHIHMYVHSSFVYICTCVPVGPKKLCTRYTWVRGTITEYVVCSVHCVFIRSCVYRALMIVILMYANYCDTYARCTLLNTCVSWQQYPSLNQPIKFSLHCLEQSTMHICFLEGCLSTSSTMFS